MEKKNINEVIANLSVEQLAGMIDHTFLKPFGTAENIEKLCAEARQYQFAMVAINPAEVETCVKLLEGSGVRVGAAIGFPLGQNTVECKAFETRDAIAKGATEIDTVINVRALQKGQTDIVKKEIEDTAIDKLNKTFSEDAIEYAKTSVNQMLADYEEENNRIAELKKKLAALKK